MKNKEVWAKYSNFTGDLSANARNMAYAAAGLCWAFKIDVGQFPPPVVMALRAVIVFFLADILQYVSGALVMKFWIEHQEQKKLAETGSIEGEYEQPRWLDYPPFTCWLVKITALLVAYAYLGAYIFQWDVFSAGKP